MKLKEMNCMINKALLVHKTPSIAYAELVSIFKSITLLLCNVEI